MSIGNIVFLKVRNVTLMRDIEGEHWLAMESDLRSQPDQIST